MIDMPLVALNDLPKARPALRPLVADYLKTAADIFILPKFGNLQSSEIESCRGNESNRACEEWQ